jgi:hypothetical protein
MPVSTTKFGLPVHQHAVTPAQIERAHLRQHFVGGVLRAFVWPNSAIGGLESTASPSSCPCAVIRVVAGLSRMPGQHVEGALPGATGIGVLQQQAGGWPHIDKGRSRRH